MERKKLFQEAEDGKNQKLDHSFVDNGSHGSIGGVRGGSRCGGGAGRLLGAAASEMERTGEGRRRKRAGAAPVPPLSSCSWNRRNQIPRKFPTVVKQALGTSFMWQAR